DLHLIPGELVVKHDPDLLARKLRQIRADQLRVGDRSQIGVERIVGTGTVRMFRRRQATPYIIIRADIAALFVQAFLRAAVVGQQPADRLAKDEYEPDVRQALTYQPR